MVMINPNKNSYRDISSIDMKTLVYSRLEIKSTKLGLGVFAAQDIAAGQPILDFQGPIINFAENYAKGEKMANPLQIDHDLYIDLEPPGLLINHSCNPNTGIIRDRSLIALQNIDAGDELFYDYSTTMDEDCWTMKCLCDEPNCRGTVTDFKYLPSHTQQIYLKRGIVQQFIARSFELGI